MDAITTTVPVPVTDRGLLILDHDRRLYAIRRRTTERYHVIQPAEPQDRLVEDGKIQVGEFCCTCPGGRYRAHCWALDEAHAFEHDMALAAFWDVEGSDDTLTTPGVLAATAAAVSGREVPGGIDGTSPVARASRRRKTSAGSASSRSGVPRAAGSASAGPVEPTSAVAR